MQHKYILMNNVEHILANKGAAGIYFCRGLSMRSINEDVVLITGASSGIGKTIAEKLARLGYKVYGTSRKQQPLDGKNTAGNNGPGFFRLIQLDVCSEASVKNAVEYVLEKEGTIDVLINNAGFGIAGSVEDTSTEEAQKQFDTNFFGVHRMLRHVLPVMRKNQKGIIINISSVAGVFSIPFQSMYSASKYALEAMSEALRVEVKPFGIKVVLVEPGDTRTEFTSKRQIVAAADEYSVYKESFTRSLNTMVKDETNGPEPDVVAKVVIKVLNRKNAPIRVAVGASYKALVILKRFVPARFAEYIIGKLYS
jgi:short-subunit dehydrogenase